MDNIKLYFAHFKQCAKCDLSYKTSFILSFLSQFIILFSSYFVILTLFSKLDNIKGYTLFEVLLCYGIINFGFSFIETFFRSLDEFEENIIYGKLDRFLVRPHNILFQSICEKIQLVKISRVLQSLIIIGISLYKLKIRFNIINVYIVLSMITSSVVLFFGVSVLMAAYCFWTVQALEIKNLVTDGGKTIGEYPMGIFKKGLLKFFTFVIPLASVNYYPLLYLVGKSANVLYLFAPWLVFIFLIISILIFNIALKHYTSTGS